MIANGAECEPLIHKDAELMKHFPAEILAGMTAHDGRDRARRRQVRHQDQERRIAGGAASSSLQTDAHRVRDAGRFLSLGRRVRAGLHGHGPADSAGRHSAAGGLRGEQRRDAVQRAPGRAGTAGDARSFFRCAARCSEPKSFWAPVGTPFRDLLALAGGATVGGFRHVRQRHDDGHADLRPGRRGDQDHRRADRAAARPLPDDARARARSRR